MPQNPTEVKAGKVQGLGWLWVAVIVIIVAGILFIFQKKAPAQPTSNQTAPTVTMKDIPVTPSFTSKPKSINAGTIFGVDWKIDAAEQTLGSETAVRWDFTSHPGTIGLDVTPEKSNYPNSTQAYAAGNFVIPGTFEDNIRTISTDAGKILYMRIVVTVAGKNYWSDEIAVSIDAVKTMQGGS